MQPSLSELTRRFLNRPAPKAPAGDVEPYDVQSAFLTDPQAAWQEALVVLKALGIKETLPEMPPDWPAQIRQQAPVRFLPMALGHYPQMVSDLSRLLMSQDDSIDPSPTAKTPAQFDRYATDAAKSNEAAMNHWAAGRFAEARAAWEAMPNSVVKSFNLGLANLQLKDALAARAFFKNAIALLPPDSGWTMLAELYLALAESKS